MTTRTIYLAGSIAQATYAGATDWYRDARAMLDNRFELLRPMRGKEFLEEATAGGLIGAKSHPHPLTSNAAIMTRDTDDVRRADFILMNLTYCGGKISAGCMIEVGMAYVLGKPLILVAEPGNVHEGHVMLEHAAAYRCHTLEEACEVANALLPGAEWEAGRTTPPRFVDVGDDNLIEPGAMLRQRAGPPSPRGVYRGPGLSWDFP